MVCVKKSESDFLMILLLFLLLRLVIVIIVIIVVVVVVVSDCFLLFCVFVFAAVFHPHIFQKAEGIKSFMLNGLLSFDEM